MNPETCNPATDAYLRRTVDPDDAGISYADFADKLDAAAKLFRAYINGEVPEGEAPRLALLLADISTTIFEGGGDPEEAIRRAWGCQQ